jgi:beta-fructofuranosidase
VGLRLPDRWLWDSWFVWDGPLCHAFYLCASRGLRDPQERHRMPSIGHAVSRDLMEWEILPDALAPSLEPAFDSWTTWTGSTVKADDGSWLMFYTGSAREDGGLVQRIGVARSEDLLVWTKLSEPVLEADPRWYETLEGGSWPDQAWRDPWVFRRPGHEGWGMLITARHRTGEPFERAAVGFATSENLHEWTVREPLSEPGHGFGQYEVLQYAEVDGVPILLFCCGWRELSERKLVEVGKIDATYSLVVDPTLENLDFGAAQPFDGEPVYAGRLVQDPSGDWFLLGFYGTIDGKFVGEISDPIPVSATPELGLIRRIVSSD